MMDGRGGAPKKSCPGASYTLMTGLSIEICSMCIAQVQYCNNCDLPSMVEDIDWLIFKYRRRVTRLCMMTSSS